MTALLKKLCIASESVKFIAKTYIGIQAVVYIGGRLAPTFDMH